MDAELQEHYMEYHLIQQRMEELQKQGEAFIEQRAEIKGVIKGLDDLKAAGEGKEVLFPISSGIFAKAILQKTDELLINVGSNVVIKKDIAGAQKLLLENLQNIMTMQAQLDTQLQELSTRATELEKELE